MSDLCEEKALLCLLKSAWHLLLSAQPSDGIEDKEFWVRSRDSLCESLKNKAEIIFDRIEKKGLQETKKVELK